MCVIEKGPRDKDAQEKTSYVLRIGGRSSFLLGRAKHPKEIARPSRHSTKTKTEFICDLVNPAATVAEETKNEQRGPL
ncbi:hypothetical protein TKK_0018924 [Trichogramma kaykai]